MLDQQNRAQLFGQSQYQKYKVEQKVKKSLATFIKRLRGLKTTGLFHIHKERFLYRTYNDGLFDLAATAGLDIIVLLRRLYLHWT